MIGKHIKEHAILGISASPHVYNAVSDYGADPTGAVSSVTAIQAAIDAAWNAGGGWVVLPANPLGGFYSIPTKLVARPGVTVIGHGYEIAQGTGAFTRGTILKGNGTAPCFTYNESDLGADLDANTLQAHRLSGFNLNGLAFDNFTYAVKFGARFDTGIFHGTFENLYANNCKTWGFWFENCSICVYHNIIVRLMSTGAVGSIAFLSSQSAYNHGNSRITSLFAEPVADLTRGIVFWAKDGSKYNDNNGNHIQCNTGSGGKVSQAATMANASPNITVVDGTKFPLDMPVTVSATANGFTRFQAYFVISNAANVIQLSNYMRGTAINATGNTAVNIDCYGFPALEFVAFKDNAGNRIQPSEFSGLDAEGYATCSILCQTCDIDLSIGTAFSGQGTFVASVLCARDFNGKWSSRTVMSLDFNSSNKLWCEYAQVATDSDPAAIVQTALPVGNIFDRSASVPFLSMGTLLNGNSRGLTYVNYSSTSAWYPNQVMMQRATYSNTTSKNLLGQDGGSINYYGSTATTWTLPLLVVGNGGTSGASTGFPYCITNNASANVVLTIACNGSDTMRWRGSAKTSIQLARGQTVRLNAQYDTVGQFWQVVALDPPESVAQVFVTKTGNYTMTENETFCFADATSGNITITLALANTWGTARGQRVTVKRIDASANTVTVNTSGTDTIDGAASTTIAATSAKDFFPNGVNPAGDWKVI